MNCQARQHSDQMVCEVCELVWDMNDPDPPACLAKPPHKLGAPAHWGVDTGRGDDTVFTVYSGGEVVVHLSRAAALRLARDILAAITP